MSKCTPTISVVCAWYGRADSISDTVESLLGQNYPKFDVTIVNDGSPDIRVREILDRYENKRLRVIHQPNTGFTSAIRRAIAESTGEYIAIQGAGDISLPGRLEQLSSVLRANASVSLVGSNYFQLDTDTGVRILKKPTKPSVGDLNFSGISHGELMYRRSSYEAVGGYRTAFSVGQGADMWMRLLREKSAFIVDEPLYEQRIYSDGVSRSVSKRAVRNVLNALRVENEVYFRKTGVDLLDAYGVIAFAMLSNRWRVSKAMARSRMMLGLQGEIGVCDGFSSGWRSMMLVGVYKLLDRFGLYH